MNTIPLTKNNSLFLPSFLAPWVCSGLLSFMCATPQWRLETMNWRNIRSIVFLVALGCALTISDCPEFQSFPSHPPTRQSLNHSIWLGAVGWSVSLVQYTGILVDYMGGEYCAGWQQTFFEVLHSPLQDLINFLPLFANPRHFLVIARLDQRDDEDGNDRHDILVPRGHSMYICTYMLRHGYVVLAASPSGRNRINMIQSSPQCVPALLHQPPPTTERHTYNRGWHIGSGWRYCQSQVMGNAWCVLVYRETDRETRNCSVPLLRSTERVRNTIRN